LWLLEKSLIEGGPDASYERDSESGNDYALMRTSINRLGRFFSPDPLAGREEKPQLGGRLTSQSNKTLEVVRRREGTLRMMPTAWVRQAL
jgi:hypothetical protein